MKRIVQALAALAVVMTAAVAGAAEPKIEVGKPAPPFKLRPLKGEVLDRDGLRGQVVVVNIWATWCGPCRAEFLEFERYQKARGKYGLTIIAVEQGGAPASGPMRKLAEVVSFPVVLSHRARAPAYLAIDGKVPSNYVIDRAGRVRYAKSGAFTLTELDEVVRPLLNEPAPADVTAALAE